MVGIKRRFSTGLPFLDQRLDGGIPIQSIVVFLAPPNSQAQMFLREVTKTQPCHYISTDCPDENDLRERFSTGGRHGELSVGFAPPGKFVESPREYVSRAEPESYIVLDTTDSLEQASYMEYVECLTELKRWIHDNDSVVFLNCHHTPDRPPRRSVTFSKADQIWTLQLQLLSKDIKNQLYVTKSRNSRGLSKPVPLILTDQVRVDTSRNI